MIGRTMAILTAVGLAAAGWGAVITVTNANDSGAGSLRAAIQQANTNAPADTIVFDASMAGRTIKPTTALPYLTDDFTIIDGDINNDAVPDVYLCGKLITTSANGLWIEGDYCTIEGLAIGEFPSAGISLLGAKECSVLFCHVGVNLAGTDEAPNGTVDINLALADHNYIGGPSVLSRNIIRGGKGYEDKGIWIQSGNHNHIEGNYIGLKRDGTALGTAGQIGISIVQAPASDPPEGNIIGGSVEGAGNVIGKLWTGIQVSAATNTLIQGNTLGLEANGGTPAPITGRCLVIEDGSTGTGVGGTTDLMRNVFAGGSTGIALYDAGTGGATIAGNYFGTNRAGTRRKPLVTGIYAADVDINTIGGSTGAARNYFTPNGGSGSATAIHLHDTARQVIRGNRFGVLPAGGASTGMRDGVWLEGTARAVLRNNRIVHATRAGVLIGGTSTAAVYQNVLGDCLYGVYLLGTGTGNLGNLGDTNPNNNGLNTFNLSNTWAIYNDTAGNVKAEGNDFRTTVAANIEAKIFDQIDQTDRGRVDYDPLKGGVHPSDAAAPAAVVVTALAAQPTNGGVAVTFALSGPATVQAQVLNVAGRPVKTLCTARPCGAGTNTLLWTGQSDRGLAVPSGPYLVELTAAAPDGSQAKALTRVQVNR